MSKLITKVAYMLVKNDMTRLINGPCVHTVRIRKAHSPFIEIEYYGANGTDKQVGSCYDLYAALNGDVSFDYADIRAEYDTVVGLAKASKANIRLHMNTVARAMIDNDLRLPMAKKSWSSDAHRMIEFRPHPDKGYIHIKTHTGYNIGEHYMTDNPEFFELFSGVIRFKYENFAECYHEYKKENEMKSKPTIVELPGVKIADRVEFRDIDLIDGFMYFGSVYMKISHNTAICLNDKKVTTFLMDTPTVPHQLTIKVGE